MQRTFLAKLRANGVYYLIGSLLLAVGIPLYQVAILIPQGYSSALAATGSGHYTPYLGWIFRHTGSFLVYRLLLIAAFVCLWSLPFTLFRIIVAQEILGREEEDEESEDETEDEEDKDDAEDEEEEAESAALLAEAWRGKGFAVLAAWMGLVGIVVFAFATLASTTYLTITSFTSAATVLPASLPTLSSLFTILTYTVGGGLLGLSCLLFGVVISRAGLKLWPGIWVAFGYAAILLTAFLISSAVGVATVSNESQSIFTTPAILLFALWAFWFGLMLVRLKPETT
ncbi:MAG TPA: hypothetical protein VKV40_20450 [Ktedonobacteraceae bacterium]|nr:hypothetical protein [Ktedonobacteraceae bacterium]